MSGLLSIIKMRPPLLLYSTQTLLAYHINERYYGGLHYVWCSEFFGSGSIAPGRPVPPSACPQEIYEELLQDIQNADRHSDKIRQNKAGLRRGADFEYSKGIITDSERLEIFNKVRLATFIDFKPWSTLFRTLWWPEF